MYYFSKDISGTDLADMHLMSKCDIVNALLIFIVNNMHGLFFQKIKNVLQLLMLLKTF